MQKKTTSNRDWRNPHDPDSRVTKMKDGRTHKAEHAVDLDTGALLAVTLPTADLGDTATPGETFTEAQKRLRTIRDESTPEVVADKGHHSDGAWKPWTSWVSGPTSPSQSGAGERGRVGSPSRSGSMPIGGGFAGSAASASSTANGVDGANLRTRLRDGRMRRLHLRGSQNILKRLLVHGAAFNAIYNVPPEAYFMRNTVHRLTLLSDGLEGEFRRILESSDNRSTQTLMAAGEIAHRHNLQMEQFVLARELQKIPTAPEREVFKVTFPTDTLVSSELRIVA